LASLVSAEPVKRDVLSGADVRGGLVVHLGCRSAALLGEFASDKRFVAHGLVRHAGAVAAVRTALAARGLYGRASAEQLIGTKLPYADHLVRFLVVEESLGVDKAEMLRVLCPRGVLYRKTPKGWRRTVKPRPAALDEWTHARHGADGNVVSRDRLVGPPTNARWISGLRSSERGVQDTQVIVSSTGRLFAAAGHRKLSLIARDAFSGIVLWERPYSYKMRSLGYRTFWRQAPLIAVGPLVYIAGKALDAGTGKEAFSFAGDPKACADGVLITEQMRALDAKTGKEIWRHSAEANGLALAGRRAYITEGKWPEKGGPVQLVCLDLKTGKVRWRREIKLPTPATRATTQYDGYSPRSTPNGLLAGIVHHRGVLALEVTRTYIHLFSASDGTPLRSVRYKNWAPYASGLRALMIDGKLWLPTFDTGEKFDFGVTINAHSLADGRKVKTLKLKTPIRQRCRPPQASEAFLFLGGMNAVDLATGAGESMPIARAACHIGLVLANGLIYAPPTHCRCYSMIPGYVALESRGQMHLPPAKANNTDHRQTGPALRKILPSGRKGSTDDWPGFRQDSMRRAHVKTAPRPDGKLLWNRDLGQSEPSSPVAAGGLVLVALSEAHRIDAIDMTTGRRKWSFVAGGRIDGPPTIRGGLCVFGCRDGWVYALRLSDGVLAWRNLAAPAVRRIMVHGQLESAWPAAASVAISDETVCVAAGRHNLAEGGVVVAAFDLTGGKKKWQKETPHRDLTHSLTGGAYENLSKPYSVTPDPRPSAAVLSGWLVCDGKAVQVDRLGAFDIKSGRAIAMFDDRLNAKYVGPLKSLKNRSPRPNFEQWLLGADDGRRSCGIAGKKLVQGEGGKRLRLRASSSQAGSPLTGAPAAVDIAAIASAGTDWVVLTRPPAKQNTATEGKLLLIDKAARRVRSERRFPGLPVPHGLAVANGRVFITTKSGRLLCIGPALGVRQLETH
jgi:outer membrane protein assembly factor BamB